MVVSFVAPFLTFQFNLQISYIDDRTWLKSKTRSLHFPMWKICGAYRGKPLSDQWGYEHCMATAVTTSLVSPVFLLCGGEATTPFDNAQINWFIIGLSTPWWAAAAAAAASVYAKCQSCSVCGDWEHGSVSSYITQSDRDDSLKLV